VSGRPLNKPIVYRLTGQAGLCAVTDGTTGHSSCGFNTRAKVGIVDTVADDLTLLCTGDVHLGRYPSRIPDDLQTSRCSPRAAWHETVDVALDLGVDAVVLTGDVVDQENRYFEAYGPFEEGVAELDDAGIPTLTVSGNHDFRVFPDLVDEVDRPNLHLLGRGGEWERFTLERDGEPALHLDGWSFPDEYVLGSPLDDYGLDRRDDAPTVGVVHGDLDAAGSEYAPLASDDLRATDADAWLLGHIHAPGPRVESEPLVLYPGSPQGLDPGEAGTHGPWTVTVRDDGTVETEQVPLASVRYNGVEIDVSDAVDETDVVSTLSSRVSDHVRDEVDTGVVAVLVLRVVLTGRTAAHADLAGDDGGDVTEFRRSYGSVTAVVDRVEVETRPDIDLDAFVDDDTPVGYLAEVLQAIEEDRVRDSHPSLVSDAVDQMRDAHGAGAFRALRQHCDSFEQPGEAAAVDVLERQTRSLLDELLAQREDRQ
jgi:exonuclease SbcD